MASGVGAEVMLLCVLYFNEHSPLLNLLDAPLSTIKENGYESLCVVGLGLWLLGWGRGQEIKVFPKRD